MYAMKKLFIILTIFSMMSLPVMAEDSASELNHGRHSLRLGWGLGTRQLFHDYGDLNYIAPPSSIQGIRKTAMPDDPYYYIRLAILGMTAEEAHQFLTDYRLVSTNGPKQSGHVFLGYHYDVNSWLSAGAEVDWFYLWPTTNSNTSTSEGSSLQVFASGTNSWGRRVTKVGCLRFRSISLS